MAPRGNWANWMEFLLSCVGCMVGIGNIWRFPFICYRSGGAAFLVPYFLAMAICGLPLVFLEMSYCQFSNLGPGKVWVICPLFKGIGAGMIVLTAIISCYYNVVLSWTVYYLYLSFRSVLPWSICGQPWNTDQCVDAFGNGFAVKEHNYSMDDKIAKLGLSEYLLDKLNLTSDLNENVTTSSLLQDHSINSSRFYNSSLNSTSSSEEYWRYYVLQETGGIESLGSMRWPLVYCLLVAWICAFLCLIKGIKSSGKVVYVAATMPYFILLALLIRGCMLPGAIEGIKYYVIPRWHKLLQAKVWQDAAVQVFYSAGIGWGGISTLASYNKFNNNCYRDAMILPVLDCLTSWFAGFVIFVFLGYMAHIEGKHIDDVVASGPGLSFVTYPQAVATMPLSQLWSVLFFAMLFIVGMDSQFVHIQTIVTGLTDAFPQLAKTGRSKMALTAGLCVAGFVLGLPFTTQGGIHLLNLVDTYLSTISVMLLATCEVLVLSWIYGVGRLYEDITMMIGYTPVSVWKPLWLVITPLFCMVLWVFGILDLHQTILSENGHVWIITLGVIIGILPLLPIPLLAYAVLSSFRGTITKRLTFSTNPNTEWKSVKDKMAEDEYQVHMDTLISKPQH